MGGPGLLLCYPYMNPLYSYYYLAYYIPLYLPITFYRPLHWPTSGLSPSLCGTGYFIPEVGNGYLYGLREDELTRQNLSKIKVTL